MTLSAVAIEMLRVLALWFLASLAFAAVWVIARAGAAPDPEAAELAPRWIPQPPMCRCAAPRPTTHHERFRRGYWTPDGRLTTLAGAPQLTGWVAFTTAELLAARQACRMKPATNDIQLANVEATVTAIAWLTKKNRTKVDRACLRLAARLN
mgnify:FL=1